MDWTQNKTEYDLCSSQWCGGFWSMPSNPVIRNPIFQLISKTQWVGPVRSAGKKMSYAHSFWANTPIVKLKFNVSLTGLQWCIWFACCSSYCYCTILDQRLSVAWLFFWMRLLCVHFLGKRHRAVHIQNQHNTELNETKTTKQRKYNNAMA